MSNAVKPTKIRLKSGASLVFNENGPNSCISDLCEIDIDLKLEGVKKGDYTVDIVLRIINTGLFQFDNGEITRSCHQEVKVNDQGEGKVSFSNLSFVLLNSFEDLIGLNLLVIRAVTSYPVNKITPYPKMWHKSVKNKT